MPKTSIQSFLYPFKKYLISTHWVQSAVLGTRDKMGSDSDPGTQAGEDEINVSSSGRSSAAPWVRNRGAFNGRISQKPEVPEGAFSSPNSKKESQLVRQKGRSYENEGEC